jgi:hypothetical protein
VADNETERNRIEKYNPNPRMPLVRYVGGTWRVGGLLALSRAFGDAYLKGSDQFEGVSFYASDSYASGFGECHPLASEFAAMVAVAVSAACLSLWLGAAAATPASTFTVWGSQRVVCASCALHRKHTARQH